MPAVSIAMATFNGGNYLEEQLDSLAAQSRLPDELVVSDDASTDGTIGILEDFKRSAPFELQICRNKTNLGLNRNFERALSFCQGRIVFICDQDDVWFPTKLDRVIDALNSNPGALVAINDQIVADRDLSHTGITKLSNIAAIGKTNSFYGAGCATALRREWLDLVLPIPAEYVAYDTWLHSLALMVGVRIVIPEPLQIHRRHGSNASNSVASNPRGSTRRQYRLSRNATDTRTEWERIIRQNMLLAERLDARMARLKALGLDGEAFRALEGVEERIGVLMKRSALLTLPRYHRVRNVIGMLVSGDYKRFSGWKSATMDLVRPTSKRCKTQRAEKKC